MKFLLLGIVIAILATVAASARPSLEPVRMDWSTVTGPPGNYYKVATKKDLLVYFDITPALSNLKRGSLPPPGSSPVMGIRRRNAEGVYVPVANITSSFSATASTNGKWVAMWSGSMTLVSVDSNNNVSEPSTLGTSGGYLLSDDTFVAYDPVSPLGDGNYTIRSYQYDSSNNTWLEIPDTELTTTLDVNIFGSDYSAYLATDTHLLLADVTNSSDIHIQIYSRQADKSWKFVESVPINSTFGLPNVNLNYNGVDTLVVSLYTVQWDASGAGVVFVYTKTNGQWNEQTFTTASVGYRPQGNLGQAITFLDANSLFLSAGGDGYSTISIPNGIGKVLLLTRNSNGVWEPSLDLIDAKSDGQWGTSVGINDYDIIVPTLVWRNNAPPILAFSALPLCFQQPINVTCKDQQVSDCSQLDVTSLFTVNNAQCGAVSATLNGLSLVNNKALQAQFSFTKVPGLVASCNATVTCPVPAPVVTQTPTSKVVSGTSALELGVIAVFLASAMMVL